MLFRTTPEHEAFRKLVRDFAETEVKPNTLIWDKNNEFPTEVVKKMKDLGILGIPYPKEYGGAGRDVMSYAIAVEELSRVDGGVGVILSAHVSLGTWPIYAYGTEEQKRKYLVPLASGEKLGAFGLTEENAGSDAAGTETTAVLQGDYYLLNGKKIFITNGGQADTYVVFASTDRSKGTRGISAFIVEKGWEGFTFGTHYDKMGIRSSETRELIFNNVKVPKENLLGKEGEGFKIAMATLDGGRIGIASQALGIAQGAYESALGYAKSRYQFGQPVAFNQAISFKFADMATKLRCARMLVYSAAELKEAHEPYSCEAAMAKMYASDIAIEVTDEAVQIYGGTGYLKGMDVERMYRDARITPIYEGTNEIQRVVISSAILGKPPKKAEPAAKAPEAAPAPAAANKIVTEGTPAEKAAKLAAFLKGLGIDFSKKDGLENPIVSSDRVVSAGKGIGGKENMTMVQQLAWKLGGSVGSSRPVAESLQYVAMNRFVGVSGQKFSGSLYVACGISGAIQHLLGIKEAKTVVAINTDPAAPIFERADFGVVGDVTEIIPELVKLLD